MPRSRILMIRKKRELKVVKQPPKVVKRSTPTGVRPEELTFGVEAD